MWNDFSSPGDENREPNSENGVYEAVLLGGSHSGNIIASKPCRRPVRPSHLFKSSPKKSPAYGADEPSPGNHSSIGSNFVIQRSPLKTLNSNNSPLRSPQTSPPGKPVQRVSSILAQRQKFDLTGLNGTVLDMERLVTTPKKTPKGLDNRAVRIRINSSKVISGSSPMSGKGSQPSVSNKNSRYDMFPAEAAFSVQETRTTALSAFELIEQEGQKQDRKMNSSRVKNITPTVTPGPTVYNDHYHTSSGGVSLSRPSVQRSHSRQPSSSNSSNSKDSKLKKTPEKKITPQRKSYAAPRKLETELRPSPLKRKEALPYQDVKTMDTQKILNGPKVNFIIIP